VRFQNGYILTNKDGNYFDIQYNVKKSVNNTM
jgi:hypothetical protein